jgi:hypothetical protein
MKVTEQYHRPRNSKSVVCHLCKQPVDFSNLIQYKHNGTDALVFAQVGFMDGEGNPVYLCAACRVLAYPRLGNNMAQAEYKIIEAEAPARKTRQKKLAL